MHSPYNATHILTARPLHLNSNSKGSIPTAAPTTNTGSDCTKGVQPPGTGSAAVLVRRMLPGLQAICAYVCVHFKWHSSLS
jgi:hypothetical protein